MCCGALQAAMYILADSIYISGLVFNLHSITGAEKPRLRSATGGAFDTLFVPVPCGASVPW